ncbi:MAG: aldehyde dehydrogenase family protein, partial [Longimicrobiales bacterium]
PEMTIAREEIFGPVLSLIRVADLDEAYDVVNRSRYGNAASLFTEKGRDAKRFRHEVESIRSTLQEIVADNPGSAARIREVARESGLDL